MQSRPFRLITIVLLTAAPAITGLVCLSAHMRGRTLSGFERAPCIHIQHPVVDLGVIRSQRESRREHFEIENVGEGPLWISDVKGACPCLELSLDRAVLLPGEKACLSATIHVPNRLGQWSETILVLSNDPKKRICKLTVQGYVEVPCTVIPSTVYIDDLQYGERRETAIEVLGPSGVATWGILNVSTDTDAVTIDQVSEMSRVSHTDRGRWAIGLGVRYRGLRSWEGKVAVEVSDSNSPRLAIPVVVREAAFFSVTPRTLCLQQTPKDVAPKGTIRIACRNADIPLSITAIKKPDWLEVMKDGVEQDGSLRLSVGVVPNRVVKQRAIGGQIAVAFAHSHEEISVLVFLFCAE